MSDVILTEAGIENTDATIAVTAKDKDNLLVSMLAQKRGVVNTLALVNSRSYDNLIDNIGDNILVDRSSVTISGILQELRKARIRDAYSLGRGFGEVWEIKLDEDNLNVGKNWRKSNFRSPAKSAPLPGTEKSSFLKPKPFYVPMTLLYYMSAAKASRKRNGCSPERQPVR